MAILVAPEGEPMSELEKAIRGLEKSPFVCREPVYRVTKEQIEELVQMVEDYRKRIADEEMCAGREVQSMPGSQARTGLWPFRRRTLRNGGSGRTGAGRR